MSMKLVWKTSSKPSSLFSFSRPQTLGQRTAARARSAPPSTLGGSRSYPRRMVGKAILVGVGLVAGWRARGGFEDYKSYRRHVARPLPSKGRFPRCLPS